MNSLPTDEPAGGAVVPSALDKEIQRLQQEREKLIARREAVKRETLLSLADAFARKLQAAGLTVREGIQALRPYEHLTLNEAVAGRLETNTSHHVSHRTLGAKAAGPASIGSAASSLAQSLESYAQQVLGAGWKDWLDQPNLLLGGERPNALLGQRAGMVRVRALLEAFDQAA